MSEKNYLKLKSLTTSNFIKGMLSYFEPKFNDSATKFIEENSRFPDTIVELSCTVGMGDTIKLRVKSEDGVHKEMHVECPYETKLRNGNVVGPYAFYRVIVDELPMSDDRFDIVRREANVFNEPVSIPKTEQSKSEYTEIDNLFHQDAASTTMYVTLEDGVATIEATHITPYMYASTKAHLLDRGKKEGGR